MTASIKQHLKSAFARVTLYGIFGIYIPLLLIWCSLVIFYTFHEAIKLITIFLYLSVSFGYLLFHRNIAKAVQIFSVLSLIFILWFIFIPPSNDRQWMPDVAKLPKINNDGSKIIIKNFRDFRHTPNSSQESYSEKTFDLNELTGTDMIISYWDNFRSIAHTMVCFRFKDGQNIAISLEVRKEVGETYHPTKGLFKQYEMIYVIGDEKDLIPLRTDIRKEEVFLYPMNLTVEHSKSFLLDIIQSANKLHKNPRFYHSLGQNCTTTMVDHLNKIGDFRISFTNKVLLNGISDYYAYQLNGIPTDLPFEILKSCCYISDIAMRMPQDINFSQNLRSVINKKLTEARKQIQDK